jgi:hypothetical protein
MDGPTLHNTLAGIGVVPPDELRAGLYLTQLQATRTFLFTTLANDPTIGGNVYPRFSAALQDPGLLNAFCALLDRFVGAAVSADLQAPPAAYTTYENYFDVNIFQANGGNFATNVQNFYNRNPATSRAVQALTANFQNNILTACRRIQTNWNAIHTTFVPDGHLIALAGIKSTGSDFHKDGQQVLILSFEVLQIMGNTKGADPLAGEVQVIYKPSDIEVDCLIAGNSAAVNAIHNNFQAASLFEIINGLIAAARPNTQRLQDLPTYKILPYNRGSSLNYNNAGQLPIRTSYGYIQFLEHRHAPGRNIWNWYPYGASDFKIFPKQDAVTIVRQFYQLVGQLLATACTFSIVDMHVENVIVSRYLAYLIDLEISLVKPIADVETTKLFGQLGGITGSENEFAKSRWLKAGQQGHLYLQRDLIAEPTQNRLWTMKPNAIVNPAAAGPANALFRGFADGFTVLGQGAAGNAMAAWFRRLNNAVVRYLPYGTMIFTDVMKDVYFDDVHVSDANYLQDALLDLLTKKYKEYQQDNPFPPQPDFLAVQAAYVDADFQNCDVPVFYHRIGTTGIMDSRGLPVPIPANITIYDDNNRPNTIQVQVQGAGHGQINRNTYFAVSPMQPNVQAGQVAILTNGAAAREAALHQSLLDELGIGAVPNASKVIY